uniref:G_PROTEIN_RECEP_F1_2 domain-containing protein n=1 Tax=Caenorhabditis tropicalis TaxID=1561998 RepID=A0A1I7UE26_9PELO
MAFGMRKSVRECDGIYISSNAQLKNADALSNVISWNPSIWHIYDNPKLNFGPLCGIGLEKLVIDLDVYGNLRDCECKAVLLHLFSLPYYSNCTTIIGGANKGLKISGFSDSKDLSSVLSLKNLTSTVEIYETSFENLSFLGGIEEIGLEATNAWNIILIRDNPELRRLGFDSLKKLTPENGQFFANIPNNHPDLCLSTNELQVLAYHFVTLRFDFLSICQDLYRKDGEKTCIFGDLNTMDAGCQHVIGDVVIDSGNEKNAWKLENMTNVYGSLTVEETEEMEELKFAARLRQVAALRFDRHHPMIRFNYNKNLRSVSLPSMKSAPYPYDDDQIIEIYGNSMDIFKYQKECLLFQKLVRTAVKYNKKSCDKLPTGGTLITNYTDDFIYDTDPLNKGHLDTRDYLFDKSLIDVYQSIIDHLKTTYNICAFINLFVNLPHFLILLQKEMRSNIVYIVMIGICISDITHSIGKITQVTVGWLFQDVCPGVYPFYYIMVDVMARCSQIMSRRSSSALALFIVAFRAFSVAFPMQNSITMTTGIVIVTFIMIICISWSSLYYFLTNIVKQTQCPDLFIGRQPSWVMYIHDTFGKSEGMLRVIDGYMALFVSLLSSSNTQALVIMMAMFMFISESTYGALFLLSSFFFVDFEERTYLEQLEVFAMTLSMINSIAHCLICFAMSSQYRDVVMRLWNHLYIQRPSSLLNPVPVFKGRDDQIIVYFII